MAGGPYCWDLAFPRGGGSRGEDTVFPREPRGLCCPWSCLDGSEPTEEAGPSHQFPFVQCFLLFSTQKQAWQPCQNATGMNPAPTQPGTGWGSPGKLGRAYIWPRETNTPVLSPWVVHQRRGAWGIMAWSSPYPKCILDQTLGLMGFLELGKASFSPT